MGAYTFIVVFVLSGLSGAQSDTTLYAGMKCQQIDKDSPIEETLDFNYQVFDENIAIVEQQFPEDLPLRLHDQAHLRADRSSITYSKGLAALGL